MNTGAGLRLLAWVAAGLAGIGASWVGLSSPNPSASGGALDNIPAPVPAPPRTLWMRAVGDIQLDRGIERAYMAADLGALLAGARVSLRAPDLTFANLESTVAHAGRHEGRPIAFRAHPNALLLLVDAGFDVLSLANNHSYDYGRAALVETAARLRRLGLHPVGVDEQPGETNRARPLPEIVWVKGRRLAFLAYATFAFTDALTTDRPESLLRMQKEIHAARAQADRVYVSFHWGVEYVHAPVEQQRVIGKAAIDAGADLVIGHHPHVFQGVEFHRGKPIVYSLGNFVFDQPWPHTREGLMLDVRQTEDEPPEIRLYPVRIDANPYRTRIPMGGDGGPILRKAAELSEALGSVATFEADAVRIEMGPGGGPGEALCEASP